MKYRDLLKRANRIRAEAQHLHDAAASLNDEELRLFALSLDAVANQITAKVESTPQQHSKQVLTAHLVRGIAFHAEADTRTVRRFLSGKQVASTSRSRIERAIQELGLTLPGTADDPSNS